jgi:hypothetical protein
MSVWESVEALREFAYKSSHVGVMRDRQRWFEKFDGPYMALWWIPVGQIPTPQEGKERLEYLRLHGDTPHAFSFKNIYPKPTE